MGSDVLQGIGGGALQPISQAILFESFPREKQGMAMAVYGMGVVAAPVAGPTLGWITTSSLIHDPPYLVRHAWKSVKTNYAGFGLLALGLGSLEIVMDEGQRNDWLGSSFIVAFAILTAASLAAVVWWGLRQREPIIDFRVLKEPNLTTPWPRFPCWC